MRPVADEAGLSISEDVMDASTPCRDGARASPASARVKGIRGPEPAGVSGSRSCWFGRWAFMFLPLY